MGHELRLPLQVGTSSLAGFSRASAAFFPGCLLIGSIVLPALLAPWDDALAIYPHLIVPYVFVVMGGVALIAYGRKHFALAMRERPSDALVGPDGLRIEGGRLGGFRVAWEDVESVRLTGEHRDLEIVNNEENKNAKNFWQLVLSMRDGSQTVLGSAEDTRERDSLQALCDTIHASLPKHAKPAHQTDDTPAAYKCSGCGAPVVPADAETVPCAYCRTPARISEDVRARIRAMGTRDAAAHQSDKLLEKLIRQPGALRTGFTVMLAAVPSLLAWPAALGGGAVLYALAYLRFVDVLLLSLAAFGVIAALFFLVRGQLTDRQALRLVTLAFAARAPSTKGGSHHCRQCNGPLVEPPGQMLVRCVYCGAENVLGLDARGEARKGRDQVESLDAALFARNLERSKWRGAGGIALALLAVVALLVKLSAHPPNPLKAIGDAQKLERITYDPFNELQPKVSPDGKEILYDLRVPGEESDESIMIAPATGAFRGTEMTAEKVHGMRPLWKSDGKGFVFVASGKRDVLRRVDSLRPYAPTRDLYSFGYDIDVPTMAPDGQHIAFAAADTKKDGWYLVMGALDGSPYQRLTGGLNPAWAPDGYHIAYSRTIDGPSGPYRQIMELDYDGTKIASMTQLTNEACDHEQPAYSPDGAYIVYVGNCSGNTRGKKDLWDLYVMQADGTDNEQVTDGKADVETPAWSGDYLYFSADVAGNYDIWRVKLTGRLAGHGGKAAFIPPTITLPSTTSTAAAPTTTFKYGSKPLQKSAGRR